jgi:anti-sigma factor RsiW
MSCNDLQDLIQDHVDGTLPEGQRRLLDAHLVDCEGCRGELEQVRALVGSLADLPRDSEPSSDLWPGLRARIEAATAPLPFRPPTRVPVTRLAAAAAILVAMVAASSLLWAPRDSERAARDDERSEVLAEYERASTALLEALESRRAELSPTTLDEIDRNLALIEDALARTREAMRSSPNDADLRTMHFALLDRKTSVLQDLVRLPSDRALAPHDHDR